MAKVTIWDKIDPTVLAPTDAAKPAQPAGASNLQNAKKLKRKLLVCDFIGAILWVYLVTKLFIVDVDRLILEAINPDLTFLLDYQLLAFLVAISALLLIARRWKHFFWLIYIAAFPVVVMLWKIPKAVYGRRSWLVSIAALNALASLIYSFRFYFVAYSLGLVAITFIAVSNWRPLTIASTATIAVLTYVFIVRVVANSLKRSRFLVMQQRAIVKWIRGLHSYVALQPELRNPNIDRFDKQQLELFRDRLSLGLCVYKAAEFWIHQLDTYRKSGASSAFAIAAYMWLFVQTLIGASFVNLGILRAFPGEFTYRSYPSFLQMVHYSLNALAINGIEDVTPTGNLALASKILLGITGPTVLATLALHFLVNHKSSLSDVAFDDLATDVNRATNSLAEKLKRDYEASITEAITQIANLGGTFWIAVLYFLMGQMPEPDGDSAGRRKVTRP